MLRRDGKLAILDWGQTQIAPASYRAHLCRLVIHMCAEDPHAIAHEVRTRSQVKLERPTTEALTALCYAYFDTRPSPLAEMNMFDLNNSPFLRNKIVQNTEEGFFTIRTVFLLRGMMRACGVTASMVSSWERDARAALRELPGDGAAATVPWAITTRSKRFLSRSVLGIQRMMNVGSGSRLNALEAYAATKAAEREAREDGSPGENASPGGGKRASFFYD
jgi:aarF domain-containing kinase